MVRHGLAAAGGAVLGALFLLRLADGTAGYLVQSWYEPLLAATAAGLVALGASAGLAARRDGLSWSWRATPGGLLTAGLVSLPIVIGIGLRPEPLGSRSLAEGEGVRQFGTLVGVANSAERNLYQWAYAFETEDPAALAGEAVDVVGFVYRPGAGEGRFMVARFVVACCVADAQGFVLPVQWKNEGELKDDQWVRILGRVGTSADGRPIVQATSVELIEAPSNPYIYP